MSRVVAAILFLTLCAAATAQTPSDKTKDLQAVVSTQFGPQFVLMPDFPVLTGDFNGDGVEDALFIVTSKQGIQTDTDRFHVIDPSSEYFGLGDPSITRQFASSNPGGPRYMLIIHGSGKEGWHASEPKGRFVLINLAFDRVSIGHVLKKKKVFDDISVEETGILNSFVYWNGRRYMWQPGASEM